MMSLTSELTMAVNAAPIMIPIVASKMDWPGADEIAKRFEALMQQQGQQEPTPEDKRKMDMDLVKIDNLLLDAKKKQLDIEKMETEAIVGRATAS